jgi:hypothetical protein
MPPMVNMVSRQELRTAQAGQGVASTIHWQSNTVSNSMLAVRLPLASNV